mmetsp:Transcript_20772/g.46835  ORF Transcript_20772/g.46835 Transcript_20772/m.46835 type:complete len:335 (-) Transcript_20772:2760-3764(-)
MASVAAWFALEDLTSTETQPFELWTCINAHTYSPDGKTPKSDAEVFFGLSTRRQCRKAATVAARSVASLLGFLVVDLSQRVAELEAAADAAALAKSSGEMALSGLRNAQVGTASVQAASVGPRPSRESPPSLERARPKLLAASKKRPFFAVRTREPLACKATSPKSSAPASPLASWRPGGSEVRPIFTPLSSCTPKDLSRRSSRTVAAAPELEAVTLHSAATDESGKARGNQWDPEALESFFFASFLASLFLLPLFLSRLAPFAWLGPQADSTGPAPTGAGAGDGPMRSSKRSPSEAPASAASGASSFASFFAFFFDSFFFLELFFGASLSAVT